jgi:hypothetical protein
MCVRHNLPSFRGNRHVMADTCKRMYCAVQFNVCFAQSVHRSVSEFGRASSVVVRPDVLIPFPLIPWWQFPALPVSRSYTLTSNISCTTSRFIQGPQRPQPSIFKDYTDTINAALCQLLDRVQWWIFMEGTRNKTNTILTLNVTVHFSHSNGIAWV